MTREQKQKRAWEAQRELVEHVNQLLEAFSKEDSKNFAKETANYIAKSIELVSLVY